MRRSPGLIAGILLAVYAAGCGSESTSEVPRQEPVIPRVELPGDEVDTDVSSDGDIDVDTAVPGDS